MMRSAALLAVLAAPVSAQDIVTFDPTAPYFVQQVMDDTLLLESGGRQFLCEMDTSELRDDMIVPSGCRLFGTPPAVAMPDGVSDEPVESITEASPEQDIMDAERIVEGMPQPAFQAALLSVFNNMGCVIDFSNVAETQAEIIQNTGTALGFTPDVTAAVADTLDDRIGTEIDAMESRFEIDETAQVATLVDGCEQ